MSLSVGVKTRVIERGSGGLDVQLMAGLGGVLGEYDLSMLI